MDNKRLQVDLTEKEHAELERLSEIAGLKTKREFVVNALTLFRWVGNELAAGRVIGSFTPDGRDRKQLEMPCLQGFVQLAQDLDRASPSADELRQRANRGGLPAEQVLAEMRKLLEATHGPSVRDLAGSPQPVG